MAGLSVKQCCDILNGVKTGVVAYISAGSYQQSKVIPPLFTLGMIICVYNPEVVHWQLQALD